MRMTLDKLIAELCGLRASGVPGDVEVSLAFLPVEGGHREPGTFGIPFVVDPVADDKDTVLAVHLTENLGEEIDHGLRRPHNGIQTARKERDRGSNPGIW